AQMTRKTPSLYAPWQLAIADPPSWQIGYLRLVTMSLRGTPRRPCWLISGSGGGAEVEPLEVGGPGPVEGPAGPPGIEPEQVDRGCGGGVFQAGLVQADVAGVADAGDVGGLPHGALHAGADVVSLF